MTTALAVALLVDRAHGKAPVIAAALVLAGLFVFAGWWRRRNRPRPSIQQYSQERPDTVQPDPWTDPATGRAQCSHGVLLSEGPCPLCDAMPKGPPHCGYWCELTPAGRCRDRCVELWASDRPDAVQPEEET